MNCPFCRGTVIREPAAIRFSLAPNLVNETIVRCLDCAFVSQVDHATGRLLDWQGWTVEDLEAVQPCVLDSSFYELPTLEGRQDS